MTLLTACVPTIPTRGSLLSRLLFTLTRQPAIEILVADGIRPMGDKVNEMIAAATSPHVVVIDDDDMISDAYMVTLAPHLRRGVDFVGHDVLVLEGGRFAGMVSHSLAGDPLWRDASRGASPKCPVRTEIARRHAFGNDYHADRAWSQAVHADCETGAYVPAPLYVYDHWDEHMVGTEPTDARAARPQRGVGLWPFNREAITWLGR